MEIGTSCMFSVRRCAVTVISCKVSVPVALLESELGVAARATEPEVPARTHVIAYVSLDDMIDPPSYFRSVAAPGRRVYSQNDTSRLATRAMGVGSSVVVESDGRCAMRMPVSPPGYSATVFEPHPNICGM